MFKVGKYLTILKKFCIITVYFFRVGSWKIMNDMK